MLSTVLVRSLRKLFFAPCWSKRQLEITHEKIKVHRNRTFDEEEVEIDRLAVIQPPVSTVVTMPTPILSNTNNGDTASFVSTLAGANSYTLSTPSLSATPGTIYEAYKPREKHGPLHSIALWCMEQSSFDDLTLFLIFCLCAFIFLPMPEANPAMPFFRLFLYFTMTLLTFSAACRLPHRIRLVIHPIILSSAMIMAGIAYFERVKGFDIQHGVALYKTGITFISLVEKTHVGWPGGGDILAATMDVSIISLAFNVYKSRPDSIREVSPIKM
jgi:hypothetical protein